MKIKERIIIGIISALLISGMANAQFFESQQDENTPFQSNNDYFSDTTSGSYTPDTPQIVENAGPGNPADPVPIDDWVFLLSMTGIVVGGYFLKEKSKLFPKI